MHQQGLIEQHAVTLAEKVSYPNWHSEVLNFLLQ
jgi:hypothetical protein